MSRCASPCRAACPGCPLRVLGVAGAAAALGVLTATTATPPVLIAIAAAAFFLPRVTWLGIAITTAAILAGDDGTAAVLAVACAAAPAVLLPSRPPLWPAADSPRSRDARWRRRLARPRGARAAPGHPPRPRHPRRARRRAHGDRHPYAAARRAAGRPRRARDHVRPAARGHLGRGGAAPGRDRAWPHARRRSHDGGPLGRWRGWGDGRRARRRPPTALWLGPGIAACFVVAAPAPPLREQDRARIAPIE